MASERDEALHEPTMTGEIRPDWVHSGAADPEKKKKPQPRQRLMTLEPTSESVAMSAKNFSR